MRRGVGEGRGERGREGLEGDEERGEGRGEGGGEREYE